MLDILTSFDNTLLARWIRLAVTVVPMIYLAAFSRPLGLRVSLLIKAGLSLLVLRAVLDLSASYPELVRFPILGTDDPLHGFYQSFVGGILGLGFLAAGVCAEYYRYVRTRNELNRDRQVLESVLSLLKAGILVRDEEQRVVYLDPSAAGSLGSLAGVEGMVRGQAGADADAAIRGGRGSQLVHVDQKAFQVAQAEIEPEGQHRRLTVQAWWDVTNWELGQRLSQEFVSTVSHEFRTPLTSIRGYLELALRDEALSPKVRDYLSVVQSNTGRLMLVVEDLLALSRLEAGAVAMECCDQPVGAVVEDVIRCSGESIRASGVQVSVDLPSGDVIARFDRERMHQVVSNLVSNACKYTARGGRVWVRARTQGAAVAIEVQDEGMGIPEAEQHLVFSRFFRSSEARLRQINGTGLGLVITKSLVEAMGGTIAFVSRPGSGTTFTVSLPAGESQWRPTAVAVPQLAGAAAS